LKLPHEIPGVVGDYFFNKWPYSFDDEILRQIAAWDPVFPKVVGLFDRIRGHAPLVGSFQSCTMQALTWTLSDTDHV